MLLPDFKSKQILRRFNFSPQGTKSNTTNQAENNTIKNTPKKRAKGRIPLRKAGGAFFPDEMGQRPAGYP